MKDSEKEVKKNLQSKIKKLKGGFKCIQCCFITSFLFKAKMHSMTCGVVKQKSKKKKKKEIKCAECEETFKSRAKMKKH